MVRSDLVLAITRAGLTFRSTTGDFGKIRLQVNVPITSANQASVLDSMNRLDAGLVLYGETLNNTLLRMGKPSVLNPNQTNLGQLGGISNNPR